MQNDKRVKMKQKDIPQIRNMLLRKQHGVCPICGGDLTKCSAANIVIDHDHETGAVRAVMHRGCNKVEGSVLSTVTRWGKARTKERVLQTLQNLLNFWKLHSEDQTNLIYYSHKTKAEKRQALNKKRRKAAKKRRERIG